MIKISTHYFVFLQIVFIDSMQTDPDEPQKTICVSTSITTDTLTARLHLCWSWPSCFSPAKITQLCVTTQLRAECELGENGQGLLF